MDCEEAIALLFRNQRKRIVELRAERGILSVERRAFFLRQRASPLRAHEFRLSCPAETVVFVEKLNDPSRRLASKSLRIDIPFQQLQVRILFPRRGVIPKLS